MESKPLRELHWSAWVAMAVVAGTLCAFQYASENQRPNTNLFQRHFYAADYYGWPFSCVRVVYGNGGLIGYKELLQIEATSKVVIAINLLACGALVICTGIVADAVARRRQARWQFSLTGLLTLTALIAVLLTIGRAGNSLLDVCSAIGLSSSGIGESFLAPKIKGWYGYPLRLIYFVSVAAVVAILGNGALDALSACRERFFRTGSRGPRIALTSAHAQRSASL